MRIAAIALVVWLAQASYKADLRLPSTQVRTMAAAEAPAAEFVLRDRPLSASDGERLIWQALEHLSLQFDIFAMQTNQTGIIGSWPGMHCGQRVG